MSADPFEGLDLPAAIAERARSAGLELSTGSIEAIERHARAVLRDNKRLQLTSVTDPKSFIERHIGETLEGAALLAADASGRLVDLGSGNGYPAIPLAAARPALDPVCVEASQAKAEFLQRVFDQTLRRGTVWHKQVQRRSDFPDDQPVRVLTSRAMGNWERIFPRLAPLLAPDGIAMLWAGESVAGVAERSAWKRLTLVARHALPGRRGSWIWCFRRAG